MIAGIGQVDVARGIRRQAEYIADFRLCGWTVIPLVSNLPVARKIGDRLAGRHSCGQKWPDQSALHAKRPSGGALDQSNSDGPKNLFLTRKAACRARNGIPTQYWTARLGGYRFSIFIRYMCRGRS